MGAARVQQVDDIVTAPPRVLVVEDEVLIRALLAEALREAGCEVVEAASADEALQVLGAAPTPDVVITDVRMPGRADGLQLAAQVRAARPALKLIVTSGHAAAVDARALCDVFLPKPYHLGEVVLHVYALAARA